MSYECKKYWLHLTYLEACGFLRMSHLSCASKSVSILNTKTDVIARFFSLLERSYSEGSIFLTYFALCVLQEFYSFSFLFLKLRNNMASPKKTRSGFHFVSSTLCDLVHIPDMLQTACVPECAVSIFSGESPKRKQTDSSMHKQLGSCGWN